LLTAGGPFSWADDAPRAYRILVEPNVQVSKDGPAPHVEPTAAACPTDPKVFLAAAMVFRASGPSQEVRVYASRDGGSTWADHLFPERTDTWTSDPQIGFAPDGTAYALMEGNGNFNTLFYRSPDSGRSWERIKVVPPLGDYPQMAVDLTT